MAYQTLRALLNKPGITYDANKVYVMFAEDWAQIQSNFDYIIANMGGGGGTWGSITGTLSDQTDLQNALNAKANLDGAVFTGSISATNFSGSSSGSNTGDNSPNSNSGLVHTNGDETIGGEKNFTGLLKSATKTILNYFTTESWFGASAVKGGSYSGNYNILLGGLSGANLTSGSNHVGIGYETLKTVTNALRCTAVGYGALKTPNGSDNTAVGYNAGVSGSYATQGVFIGSSAGANSSGSGNIFVGYNNSTGIGSGNDNVNVGSNNGMVNNCNRNTIIGASCNLGSGSNYVLNSVGIGYAGGDMNGGSYCTYLGGLWGPKIPGAYNASIGIGYGRTVTASNQLVIGTADSNGAILDVYIGSGVQKASPADTTHNATGGTGTNNKGADYIVASGRSTGNIAGTSYIVKTPTPGASGTALQALAERMRVNEEYFLTQNAFKVKKDGSVIIVNSATPASAGATGEKGTVTYDDNYMYICVQTNTWKRVALSTW